MAMMSWMRRISRYLLAAVVLTFVASLAYFGATQDRSGPQAIGTVNGEAITAAAYRRAYKAAVQQYQQVLKERFTPELARSLRLQDQVVERLVLERLLEQRAVAEGLRVSDDEVREQITRIREFQEGGRFSRERYLRGLAGAQLAPVEFEEDLRGELLRQKLQVLIAGGVKVSEPEARQQWEIERARVRAAYLLVTPAAGPDGATVGDDEVKAYYDAHPNEFTRPERRRVLLALLSAARVSPPAVSDADIEAAYKARQAEFDQPRRVRVAHILVRIPTVGGSAAEDQAKAKAEAALQRVRQGTDFAKVAQEVSEDTATASRGGEVGLVGPGELVAPFEQAAFALKAGEVAGPVRTPFGFHVIKTLEVLPAAKKLLKEVAPSLRATLAAEGQLKALDEKAQEVRRALLGAKDFAEEARRLGLTVREIGPLTRTDAVEGIGRVSEATTEIFELTPDRVSAAVKVPEGYVIFKLLERQEAGRPPLAEVRSDVIRALGRQKVQGEAQTKARHLAEALRKGEDPRALAKREGATFEETGSFSRMEPLGDKELGEAIGPVALALPAGGVGDPAPGPKGIYVVKVLGRERPAPGGFEAARPDVETRLLQQKRTQTWQALIASLRGRAKIEINRKVLPEA